MSDTETLNMDRLTAAFIKIRDARAALSAKFKEEDAELVSQMDVLRHSMLKYCADNGVESVRTNSGTFFRGTKVRYWTSDWASMHGFILEHDAPDLLEKRINQTAMRDFLEENPNLLPPGLNKETEYVVTVRQPRR